VAFLGKNQINLEVVEAELKNIDPFSKPDNFLKSSYVEKAPSFLSKIKPSNIGKAVSGLVYGAFSSQQSASSPNPTVSPTPLFIVL
jgi:hypothetical protein